jgi:CheY-like chemotaxis protein
MPIMGGEEALKLIRKSENGADTPIVALTAHALVEDQAKYLAAGFDGYLSKPFNKKQFYDILAKFLPSNITH